MTTPNAMEGMPVKLKTYQAYTMAEALAAVRKDLGAGAIILNTRTFKRGSILGLRRRTIVEVTATLQERPKEHASARSKPARTTHTSSRSKRDESRNSSSSAPTSRNAAAQRAYAGAAPEQQSQPGSQSSPQRIDAKLTDQERTRRFAKQLLEEKFGEKTSKQSQPAQSPESAAGKPSSPPPGPESFAADSLAESSQTPSPKPPQATAGTPGTARRFVLQPEEFISQPAQVQKAPVTAPSVVAGASGSSRTLPTILQDDDDLETSDASTGAASSSRMQEELSAIRDMVGRVLQHQTHMRPRSGDAAHPGAIPTMPAQLFDMYLKLVGQDISEELADRIINDIRDELTQAQLDDERLVKDAAMRHLADYIPTAMHAVPSHSPDDRPLTIALIGPTGVGKTTTLAKLAATFKLRHQRRVGLITSDTYRIAAVEQLRTYANIIGLPVEVVLTPAEMRQAMHKLSGCDVVLIDTAGRSQNDASRIDELKRMIEAAAPHEVHLVLSGTASEKVLIREAEVFSAVGIHKIVLTKLDEAVSFGMLINVIRQIGKELSFVTTGQEVPDHIEPGRAERLAELVMGGSVHS